MTNAQKEPQTAAEHIEAFLIKYRIILLSVIGALFFAALVSGIVFAVTSSIHKKGLEALDNITTTLTASSEEYEQAAIDALARLETLVTSGGIVGARANMLAAEIHFKDKNWTDARNAWLKAADLRKSSYLAPLALYNAAVCSEELGEPDAALQYFEKAAAARDFALKGHALFNAGRIKDAQGDYEGAAKSYTELTDTYADDSWANLAMSRLIALRAEGKIQ
jgi:tetratricopeptide (TPR) repeat protein